MSKTTGTVRVKPTGERFCYSVESWSKPGEAHRVDLLGRGGFGLCSCKRSDIAVHVFIRDGGSWYDPKAACRHVIAARRFFEHQLYSDLAKTERES